VDEGTEGQNGVVPQVIRHLYACGIWWGSYRRCYPAPRRKTSRATGTCVARTRGAFPQLRCYPAGRAVFFPLGRIVTPSFGSKLRVAFDVESAKATFSEVQLFRALIESFRHLRPKYLVEEYHGFKHQVYFNGAGAWARTPARCELCDVLFVVYRTTPQLELRASFLQAKLSREKHPTACSGYPTVVPALNFKANLEQWDLLARRPVVLPVPPFDIHPLALSSAQLPSIGSFGIFHRSGKKIEFTYASADTLAPVGMPKTKNARLSTAAGTPRTRSVAGNMEATYCCCLPTFGDALYALQIGSPIHATSGPNGEPLAISLARILREYVRTAGENSTIAREILGSFDLPSVEGEMGPLPSLILIKSEAERAA
jgi:hypothetical protein